MATAPKAAPKAGHKPAAEAAAEVAPKKSKKKLIILIAAAVVVLGGGGGAAMVLMHGKQQEPAKEKVEAPKLPVYVILEPFVVNLLQDNGTNDQFVLQVKITIQVADAEQEDLIKNFMPAVRNRLLILISSKKKTEIDTPAGKKKLAEDIKTALDQPLTPKGPPQTVSDILFTDFVIQAQ